jgi:hypothetical protein
MSEPTASSTRRIAVIAAVLGVVAIVGVIALGFVLPAFTGTSNLVELFNAVRPGR